MTTKQVFKIIVAPLIAGCVVLVGAFILRQYRFFAKTNPKHDVYSKIISAKLQNDNRAYSLSLLRAFYLKPVDGWNDLPSENLIGAFAVVYLSEAERQQQSGWRKLLNNWGSKQPHGLISIAYTATNIESQVVSALEKSLTSPKMFLFSENELATQAEALANIEKELPNVDSDEVFFRNSIVARTTSQILDLLSLKIDFRIKRDVFDILQAVARLSQSLPKFERDVLLLRIKEMRTSYLNLKGGRVLIDSASRQVLIENWQKEQKFLCNAAVFPMAADFVVETFLHAPALRSKLIDINLFSNCFVGAIHLAKQAVSPEKSLLSFTPLQELSLQNVYKLQQEFLKKPTYQTRDDLRLFSFWLEVSHLMPSNSRLSRAGAMLCQQSDSLCSRLRWELKGVDWRINYLSTAKHLTIQEREQLTYQLLNATLFGSEAIQNTLSTTLRVSKKDEIISKLMRSLPKDANEVAAYRWLVESQKTIAIF